MHSDFLSRTSTFFYLDLSFSHCSCSCSIFLLFCSCFSFGAFSSFFLIFSSLHSFLAVFFLYRHEVIISDATFCLYFVITLDHLGCGWMDCGVIILWLPAELEDVQSADMSESGLWKMCGDTLGWIFLRYFSLLRLFIHI